MKKKYISVLAVIMTVSMIGCGQATINADDNERIANIKKEIEKLEEENEELHAKLEDSSDSSEASSELESDINEEPWKEVYRQYLNRVMLGDEALPDLLETLFYYEGSDVFFALDDITGDGIPELWVSGPGNTSIWRVMTTDSEGSTVRELGCLTFFDKDQQKGYFLSGTSFEGYDVFTLQDGNLMYEYGIGSDDSGNYKQYTSEETDGYEYVSISDQEMDDFRKEFENGRHNCGVSGILLNLDNIQEMLGTSSETYTEDADWKNVYLVFINDLENSGEVTVANTQNWVEGSQQEVLQKGTDANEFCLYDINLDGIPELLWYDATAVEIYHFLSADQGIITEFEDAGRRATGWKEFYHVKNTPYYVTIHFSAYTHDWILCSVENGICKAMLSVSSPDMADNYMNGIYDYSIEYKDAQGNIISEEEFHRQFQELTGYTIGSMEEGADQWSYDFVENIYEDALPYVGLEEMRQQLM